LIYSYRRKIYKGRNSKKKKVKDRALISVCQKMKGALVNKRRQERIHGERIPTLVV